MKENNFEKNYQIDYKKLGVVEKKGRFDYISWAYAQKIMRIEYPNMTWETKFNEQAQSLNWNGFVKLVFKDNDIEQTIFYPILDNQNRPIKEPNQFDLNNAQMRGFAKGFAMLTGHGLSLFTGEDLVQYDEEKVVSKTTGVKSTIAKTKNDLSSVVGKEKETKAQEQVKDLLVKYFEKVKGKEKEKGEELTKEEKTEAISLASAKYKKDYASADASKLEEAIKKIKEAIGVK